MHRLIQILVTRNDHPMGQLFRYTIAGGLAWCADFGLLYLLTDVLGLHYLFSAALAFVAGLTVNYLISTFWVFSKRRLKSAKAEFSAFALIGLVGLLLLELFMWLLTDLASFHYLWSKVAATFLVYLWNFLARKKLLYS